jgi:hypothetical protein
MERKDHTARGVDPLSSRASARFFRDNAGDYEGPETRHARPIAATVEAVAGAGVLRLGKSRFMRIAP